MSHRTADLPPRTGLAHVIRELRYHEAARQVLAVVLIVAYAATAAPRPELAAIGLGVAIVGAIVRLYASGFIVKNQELATDGAYRFVRHPLYTGNILLVVGFALAGSHWWGIPVALFFFWFYYPTAIEYEDRKLHRIFGAPWEQWSQTVPAVVPRGFRPMGPASWSFMTSVRQNAEPIVIAFTLICIGWIGTRV
jgi:protein-S-isoprenylcysteine O-methyltransferase Ste14